VGDIPLTMQVKLLRLLESGTYRRVGGTELRRADLRVVAATHRDLARLVAQGQFREDLYHRLATFPIALPPLRERRDDLALLASALLARLSGPRRLALAPAALQRLARHPFPGNVRELRNVLERAALLSDGALIEAAQVERALSVGQLRAIESPLPDASFAEPAAPAGVHSAGAPRHEPSGHSATLTPLRAAEQVALQAALARHPHDRAALAAELGISERTLYRKLGKLRGPQAGD
jgi:DNA-binding NtrC family response regulator